MLQEFTRRTTPDTGAPRLAALRAAMAEAKVDAFLVPRADAHQGEYVAPRDERLAWLTGFTGSAGQAIVARDRAAVFVDGRYRLQVRGQVDLACFELMRIPEDKPADWLVAALPAAAASATTPGSTPAQDLETLTEAAHPPPDRPRPGPEPGRPRLAGPAAAPFAPDRPHPPELAGRILRRQARRARPRPRRARPRRRRPDAPGLASPGSSTSAARTSPGPRCRSPSPSCTPTPRVELFADPPPRRLRPTSAPTSALADPAGFGPRLDALTGRVAVDRASAPAWVSDRLAAGAAEVVWRARSLHPAQGAKNPAEIAGARAAHLRDGAAMAEFLAWLDLTAPEGGLTEIDVVKRLEGFRAADRQRCATSPSTPSPAPARTAPSSTTASPTATNRR